MGLFTSLWARLRPHAEPHAVHVAEYRAKPKAAPLPVHVPSPEYVKTILGYRSPPEVKAPVHSVTPQAQWRPHEPQGPWGTQICVSGSYGSMGPPLVGITGFALAVSGSCASYPVTHSRGGGGGGGYAYCSG